MAEALAGLMGRGGFTGRCLLLGGGGLDAGAFTGETLGGGGLEAGVGAALEGGCLEAGGSLEAGVGVALEGTGCFGEGLEKCSF